MKITLLTRQTPWYGKHTGYYEQLPTYLGKAQADVRTILPRPGLKERLLGKLYSLSRRWPMRDQTEAAAEWRFTRAVEQAKPGSIYHILSLEHHLLCLDRWQQVPRHVIGTIHQPASQWNGSMLSGLSRLGGAIVLYRSEIAFFESYVGAGRVEFIRHGIDADFFHPGPPAQICRNELLFSGQYLRNFRMLHEVFLGLLQRQPQLKLNIVVDEHARHQDGLVQLQNHPSVRWHQKIDDEALRHLYQSCQLLLLPMSDSGANNAVVEALACGLPVVTTDVGGIRDYGGGHLYPVAPKDDPQAMIALVEKYLADHTWRDAVGRQCRALAVNELAWPLIARKHLDVYRALLS